jgi:hypothetical protein
MADRIAVGEGLENSPANAAARAGDEDVGHVAGVSRTARRVKALPVEGNG